MTGNPTAAADPHRVALLGILLVTTLLYFPALGTGLFGEDYRRILAFSPPEGATVPWWAGPEFRWPPLRPLSAGLFSLEWALFGTDDFFWQLPNLAAHLVMVTLVARLYRRLVDAPTALAATFAFATHLLPAVASVAEGHTLVGGIPALGALLAWRAWREDGWRPGMFLAPVCLALGLAGSETALGALVYALAGEGLRRLAWPRLSEKGRRVACFAALGAIGCLPLSATWAIVGTSLLLATVVTEAWRRRARVVLCAFGGLGVLVPMVGAARLASMRDQAGAFRQVAMAAEVQATREQEVVVVTSGDAMSASYLLPARFVLLGGARKRSMVMSAAVADHRVSRTAADTLEVEVLGSSMWRQRLERRFLSPEHLPEIGEPWPAGVFTAMVLAEDAYGPTRVSFRFPVPLEDPRYVFLAWQDGRLARFTPPSLGEVTVLHWSFGPMRTTP